MVEVALPELERFVDKVIAKNGVKAREVQEREEKETRLKALQESYKPKDYKYLKRSAIFKVFQKASEMLTKAGVEHTFVINKPISENNVVKLAIGWDHTSRSPYDAQSSEYSWKEMNAAVVRLDSGRVVGIKINSDYFNPGFSASTSIESVADTFDKAFKHPLRVENTTWSHTSRHFENLKLDKS